jgi:hypothetical protein
VRVTRYQRTDTVHLAEVTCLGYGSFHTRTVRVMLLRDDTTDTGYDLALVTTDLTSGPAGLITRYARRWSIEVTFAEARNLLGAGQAHNRTRAAVERTVPFGLYCYTITVAWYALHVRVPIITSGQVRPHVPTRGGGRRVGRVDGCRGGRGGPVR